MDDISHPPPPEGFTEILFIYTDSIHGSFFS